MSKSATIEFATRAVGAGTALMNAVQPDTHGNGPLTTEGLPAQKRHDDAANGDLRLNALFAISVNSPSMSMVNFPCCVDGAPISVARGVRRRVTPQPAVVGMKAGDDA